MNGSAEVDPTREAGGERVRGARTIGGYQPGLDGVRALAVLAVAAYHARLPHASGGFLGVSLFFTLSGFLITALLLDEHERTGRVDLRQFWLRRFRRLVPAALLGLAVALLFAATVASRSQLDGLPGEVVASAGYVANWFFAYTDQSYTDLFSSPSPVQHYWSLAIEEQFYLVMPILLIAVLKWRSSVKVLLAVLTALVAASTVWMTVRFEAGASIDRLYYGTDTRAAELLVGAALAAALHLVGLDRLRAIARPMVLIGPVVLAGLVWAWATQSLTGSTLFRGGFLVHALASAAIVVSILIDRGPLPAVLKFRPLVWIGRISYGIYLFHWPVFLWLTPDRTGLDQWPLFGLRMTLAITLATASYFVLEQPIRRGAMARFPRPVRLVAAPLSILLLAGGTVAAAERDAFDEAETIRITENSLGIPIATADGVLDILALGDPDGAEVLDALAASASDEPTVNVVIDPSFPCDGELVDSGNGQTCANWAKRWPELIADVDPDVVILHASDWPDLTVPGTTATDDEQRSTELLNAGFDLLSENGAPILWLPIDVPLEEGLARSQRAFTKSIVRLERQRDDLHSVILNQLADADPNAPVDTDAAVTALLQDAALHQRSDRAGLPKVLVVGDSQALSLGYGLQRWGDGERTAWVWNRGAPGCPFAVDGVIRFLGEAPVPDLCRDARASFDRLVDGFDPDLVIALPGLWDLLPRRLDEWDTFQGLGAHDFDAYITDELIDSQQRLAAGGATVVWMSMPCLGPTPTLTNQEIDAQSAQRAAFNSTVLPDVLAAEPVAQLFDLNAVLCPDGAAMEQLPSGEQVRYDGLHFSVEGAAWFAETYGPELLGLIDR